MADGDVLVENTVVVDGVRMELPRVVPTYDHEPPERTEARRKTRRIPVSDADPDRYIRVLEALEHSLFEGGRVARYFDKGAEERPRARQEGAWVLRARPEYRLDVILGFCSPNTRAEKATRIGKGFIFGDAGWTATPEDREEIFRKLNDCCNVIRSKLPPGALHGLEVLLYDALLARRYLFEVKAPPSAAPEQRDPADKPVRTMTAFIARTHVRHAAISAWGSLAQFGDWAHLAQTLDDESVVKRARVQRAALAFFRDA